MGYLGNIAWLIWLLPLAAAVGITLFTLRNGPRSARLSISAVVLSFVFTVILCALPSDAQPSSVNWLTIGNFTVPLGLTVDKLSLLMLLVVTGVASLIHIYSWGYMSDDPGFSRFFAGLSLFTFAMLGIVLANNFIVLFICWELVGLASYLLIGFWYERPSAAEASKKAFLTNRLGDFGFLLGILFIWGFTGAVSFSDVRSWLAANPNGFGQWSTIIGLLIFCGAMGKSAQFPLHVWLPDAMEGPTPVSALIHAATMVAAGVYMLCRVFFLYAVLQAWPDSLATLNGLTALEVIAWIGGITSLLAALIAVQQNDIKRVLAYSTLSQLGLMIMAVGLNAPSAAMYHLSTHAFFKALLFLGAGAVIHVLHHEQNIWNCGGLRDRMPVTYWTFLIGTLAIAGVPPFSGFYSKDAILAATDHSVGLFILGTVVAVLTTFYMFRLFFVAFGGPSRSEAAEHAHEAPIVMKWPLILLGIPSILAGLWGIDAYLESHFHGDVHPLPWWGRLVAPFGHAPLAAVAGLGATAFGLSFAYALYANATKDPLPERFPALSRALRHSLYFDPVYDRLINWTHENLSRLANWIDRILIAGIGIRGLHGTVELLGRALRLVQTGNLQTYTFLAVLGIVIVLFYALR
jgi:NADH-quinone oxidoreductase subunit L